MSKNHSAQIAAAKKAAAVKAKNIKHGLSPGLITANQRAQARAALAPESAVDQPKPDHSHGPRGPPLRLLSKREVCAIVGASYPTVWNMMRNGKFPRSRIVGGKSKWRSDEVAEWMAALPIRRLKGDQSEAAA